MEWEPVFILGVMGGAMLVSAVRGVIDTQGRARPAAARRNAPHRCGAPPGPVAVRREGGNEIGELKDRVAVLEWLAAPAAAEKDRLRRGAA